MLNNYYEDIERNYGTVMMGAYEKARIWPLEDTEGGVRILEEEINEVISAYCRLTRAHADYFSYTPCSREQFEKKPRFVCRTLEGHAMSVICELLQVIAVLNKYVEVFEKEAKAESEAE